MSVSEERERDMRTTLTILFSEGSRYEESRYDKWGEEIWQDSTNYSLDFQ